MPLAILQQGEIRPLEPLPADWQDGQRLRVETADDAEVSVEDIDRDFAVLDSLCADSDPTDETRLAQALQKAREQSKIQVRRQMGMS